MLILQRTRGEAICINDDVQVRILGVKGGKVRLGLTGPDATKFDREEIYHARKRLESERKKATVTE